MVFWVVKDNEDGTYTPVYSTDTRNRPKGKYKVVRGPAHQYAAAQLDANGELEIIEDTSRKTTQETRRTNRKSKLDRLRVAIAAFDPDRLTNLASHKTHIVKIVEGLDAMLDEWPE